MACPACRKQTLLATCRALAELSLTARPPTRSFGAAFAQQPRPKRQISTSIARRHQPSQARLHEHAPPTLSQGPDDHYIPFDSASLKGTPIDATPSLTSNSFASPPPPPAALDLQWHQPPQTLENAGTVEPLLDEPSIEITKSFPETSNLQSSTPRRVAPTRHDDANGPRQRGTKRSRGLSNVKSMENRETKARGARALEGTTTAASSGGTKQNSAPVSHPIGNHETPVVRKEHWQTYKDGIRSKLGDQHWNPKKRVSPDAMEGIRAMHSQYPDRFTTPVLAKQFGVSADAIRRILKSKWRPSADEEDERRQRWDRRGERIWTDLVEQGVHPPKRWRTMGIGSGPRRPGQDRKLQRAIREGKQPDATTRTAEQDAWVRSLAQRLG